MAVTHKPRCGGYLIDRQAQVAGVDPKVIRKLRKAVREGDFLATFLLLWLIEELDKLTDGFGFQTDVRDFAG